ncbi:MAG: fumarate hydratase [Candidatus Latescibacterota bacterium]|nr:MAG: fumarate hydratase [Candidatus Latescibacterota bacterium]
MREVEAERIAQAVAELCVRVNYRLGEDVLRALKDALGREHSELGRWALEQVLENARIAREGKFPLCQDTGVAVVFVRMGQEVRIVGGSLEEAIQEGVRRGYREGYLRKSVVRDPLRRKNTGDNTPAVVHYRVVPGEELEIALMAKGAGSENMSGLAMLTPADGRDGVRRFVVEQVRRAGGKPCPPVIVGVGIGGNFELCALLAKEALLRPVGERNPDPFYARMEEELLSEINSLGIGPQGFGGRVTALDVHVEAAPCHIASLPVAVNIQCHSARHAKIKI